MPKLTDVQADDHGEVACVLMSVWLNDPCRDKHPFPHLCSYKHVNTLDLPVAH